MASSTDTKMRATRGSEAVIDSNADTGSNVTEELGERHAEDLLFKVKEMARHFFDQWVFFVLVHGFL